MKACKEIKESHAHLAFNLPYPPSSELEWNIEYRMQIDIYLFLQIMLARLRMCIFFCTFVANLIICINMPKWQ
jgi:hypothetical protein